MNLTRDNFAALLTPVHSKIFFDNYNELEKQYDQYSKVEDMDRAEETEVIEGGFGLWDENSEGNTINEDSMSEGNTITFTPKRFDKGYEITWELIQDDIRNVLRGKGKGGSAENLAKGLNATVETLAAYYLNNGFANTGYDGVSLFNNAHPLTDSASTCDNLLTGALSPTTLKAACTLMRQTVNEAGIQIVCKPKKLLVPNELEFTAKEILMSTNQSGEISNTKNVIPGLKLLVLDYLTDADAWFVQADEHGLVFKWRERPWFDSRDMEKKVDKFFFGFARMVSGYRNWRGIIGSAGA